MKATAVAILAAVPLFGCGAGGAGARPEGTAGADRPAAEPERADAAAPGARAADGSGVPVRPECERLPVVPADSPCSAAGWTGFQAELDAIADCFRRGVAVLDDEPRDGEPLPAFFERVATALKGCDREVPAGLGAFGSPAAGSTLVLSDGSAVTGEREELMHDSFAGGAEAWTIRWTFRAAGHGETAAAELTLEIGGE